METFNALEMAKRRWPHCSTTGTGNFAVILNCCYTVVLCDFLLTAKARAGEKCCPNCAHGIMAGKWHEVVELKSAPVHIARPFRNAALMERD